MSEQASARMKAVTDAVKLSTPNLNRPRMSTEAEQRLYTSDRDRAIAYAMMEDVTEQIRAVADEIESEDGVPVFVDEDEENSLVTSIENLRRMAHEAR